MLNLSEQYCQGNHWLDLTKEGLRSSDNHQFHMADRIASKFDIDTWPIHWQRLQNHPDDSGNWFNVMQRATPDTIDEIIQFALQTVPLDQIGTGPAEERGFGQDFNLHNILDFIVQDLKRFPHKGWPLIYASLRSPVIRGRNMALRVISNWDRKQWTPEMESALQQAFVEEPREDVKERIKRIIDGEPYDDTLPN